MKHELPQLGIDFINYLKANDMSNNTIVSYEQVLHDVFIFLIEHKHYNKSITTVNNDFVKSITIMDLNAFMAHLNSKKNKNDKSYSAETRRKYVACIKSFFSFIIEQCMLKIDNPALFLKSPKKGERLPKYLTQEQVQQLLSVIDSNINYERDYAIIKLYVNSGMRLSELINLNLSDMQNNTLTIIGKGDKERTIYLNNECITSINKYLEVRPETKCQALFLRYYRYEYGRMTASGIEFMVMKYAEKANLPKWFTTHKLRHTFATEALTQGIDLTVISDALGHTNVTTTAIYAKVVNKNREKLALTVSF